MLIFLHEGVEKLKRSYFTRDELHLFYRISIVTNWCLSNFSQDDLLARIEYALTDPDRRRELDYELLLVDEVNFYKKIRTIDNRKY